MRMLGVCVAMLMLAACSKSEAPRAEAAKPVAPAAPAPAPVPAPPPAAVPSVATVESPPPPPAPKLADPAHRAERDAARDAAGKVPGVRTAAWLDRDNLRVAIDHSDVDAYESIAAICKAIEAQGDTAGVVVNVQSGSATDGGLSVVSRECKPASNETASATPPPPSDVIPPDIRAEMQAQKPPVDSEERARLAAESLRIIERSTPQLQHPGTPDRPPPGPPLPPGAVPSPSTLPRPDAPPPPPGSEPPPPGQYPG